MTKAIAKTVTKTIATAVAEPAACVQFLVSCLLPRYKLTKRIQDEVPRMLKLFMYPLTITKSAMCSMSSPLTWPTMLAALSWLQQLIDVSRPPQSIYNLKLVFISRACVVTLRWRYFGK